MTGVCNADAQNERSDSTLVNIYCWNNKTEKLISKKVDIISLLYTFRSNQIMHTYSKQISSISANISSTIAKHTRTSF